MILSDAEIKSKRLVEIEPFSEKNLTPSGYDLSIGEVMLPDRGEGAIVNDGWVDVPPMSRFVVSTVEYVRLSPRVAGELWLRTSWARRGVLASFGLVDPGFEGTLTLAAFNSSTDMLRVEVGKRFAQIVFHVVSGGVEKTYAERSGKYQGQRGVTLSRE